MSVRKREWITAKGEQREAWVVDYVDQAGQRHLKTFDRKKAADAYAATSHVQVREGTYVADSTSVTVHDAGKLWITASQAAGLERTTVDQYRQHLDLHIVPFIGRTRLSQLTVPEVRAFEDKLLAGDAKLPDDDARQRARSREMVKRVLRSLGALLSDAQERGLVTRNVVRDMRGRRRRGKERQAEGRKKGKLKVGVAIPLTAEIRSIIEHLQGKWRPVLVTAIFTGLRASELRGLRWVDVDLAKARLRVHQRADRYNVIGAPKSIAGEREVPLPPMAVNALKQQKLAAIKGELGLVFPTGAGNVESISNIVKRGFLPAQTAAGIVVVTDKKDEHGKRIVRAKYTGMHSLRHWYASWCINPRPEGLGLPAKVVQERLGHSSIAMTMDVYGHLFPRGDDAKELAEAENAMFS